MTLWFDSATLDMYIDTNNSNISYQEFKQGERAYIKIIVPSGTAFDFNSDEFRKQFDGCDICIELPDKSGSLKEFENRSNRGNKKLGLVFEDKVEIVVSADEDCTGLAFEN